MGKETIKIITPQFERTDGKTITHFPKTEEEYKELRTLPDEKLLDMGCQKWDDDLWVFPAEWYDHIPNGLEIIDIFGETEKFEKGVTDDDMRFGALAFGFKKI